MTRVASMERTMSWRGTVRLAVRPSWPLRARTLQGLRFGSTDSRPARSGAAGPGGLRGLRRAPGPASAAWTPDLSMTTSRSAGALDAFIAGQGMLVGLAEHALSSGVRGLRIHAGAGHPGTHYECLGHLQVEHLFVEAIRVELSAGWQAGSAAHQRGVRLLHMISGSGRWRQGDTAVRLRAGESLKVDAGVAHGFEAVDEFPLAYLWVAVTPLDVS